jgi:hypothetical protein
MDHSLRGNAKPDGGSRREALRFPATGFMLVPQFIILSVFAGQRHNFYISGIEGRGGREGAELPVSRVRQTLTCLIF